MEILILADSHADTMNLRRIADMMRSGNYAQTIHLGDHASDADTLERMSGMSVIRVKGNCDPFYKCARTLTVELGCHKAFITHGDAYSVRYELSTLSYAAAEAGCDIAMFGHTHAGFSGYVGGVLIVNPGALRNGCYGILSIDGAKLAPFLRKL